MGADVAMGQHRGDAPGQSRRMAGEHDQPESTANQRQAGRSTHHFK
jgi:hypothetical protein